MKKFLLSVFVFASFIAYSLENRGYLLLKGIGNSGYPDTTHRERVVELNENFVLAIYGSTMEYSKEELREYVETKDLYAVLAKNNKKYSDDKKEEVINGIFNSYLESIKIYSLETGFLVVEHD